VVRVLLVDSDAEARGGLVRRIERIAGIELVGAAGDADGARALLDSNTPDVVLADLHRRDAQEEQLCRELRRLTRAPLVVLASFMTPDRWEQVKAAGATAYLLKHIDTDQLGRELEGLARQHATSAKE
jgi:DNA-binding NarL/FixJ family response regulator